MRVLSLILWSLLPVQAARAPSASWEQVPPLAFEVRYLLQLDDSGFGPRQQFLTIGLGLRVRW